MAWPDYAEDPGVPTGGGAPPTGGPNGPGRAATTGGDDPLSRLERNQRSSRRAVSFLFGALLGGILVAIGILVSIQVAGMCEGPAYLCTRGQRTTFVAVPLAYYFATMLLSLYLTYRHWKYYIRWRPWMIVSWLLSFAALAWMLGTAGLLMADMH